MSKEMRSKSQWIHNIRSSGIKLIWTSEKNTLLENDKSNDSMEGTRFFRLKFYVCVFVCVLHIERDPDRHTGRDKERNWMGQINQTTRKPI